ncbi:MAG: hypothetical protein HY360_10960 [Verrucomicrobia bacterium]|nr:hypothetical protein [Verrucomicrobiota bacterium]
MRQIKKHSQSPSCPSLEDELRGYAEMGMLAEIHAIAKDLLQKPIASEQFQAIVLVLIDTTGCLVKWSQLIEQCHQQLDAKSREDVRYAMLCFYYAIHDFERGSRFTATAPVNCDDYRFSLEMLVALGRKDEAAQLFGRCHCEDDYGETVPCEIVDRIFGNE